MSVSDSASRCNNNGDSNIDSSSDTHGNSDSDGIIEAAAVLVTLIETTVKTVKTVLQQ